MRKLNDGLVKSAGARVRYAYYFGTRQLTADKAVMQPSDLAGQKIRAIPFPIYMSTVQGLGAVPIPVDWSEVPTALATGQVAGQENPVNVVLSSKLHETPSHMMLTGHIMNAQLIVINEKAWQGLSPEMKAALTKAAEEVRTKATEHVRAQEADARGRTAGDAEGRGPPDGRLLRALPRRRLVLPAAGRALLDARAVAAEPAVPPAGDRRRRAARAGRSASPVHAPRHDRRGRPRARPLTRDPRR
jgi:hypothetical protein